MADNVFTRTKAAWNAFTQKQPQVVDGVSYYRKPDRITLKRCSERSVVSSLYNRIAMDAASITFKHCEVDEKGRYVKDYDSNLNECLNYEANLDQTGRALIQDIVMSMLDEGCVAVVPITANSNANINQAFDPSNLRVAKIIQWYPQSVKCRVYNEYTGRYEDLIYNKRAVAIIENPFYAVMNEDNSTVQRLIRKLSLLDVTDEQTASGKLDIIVQLPYTIKTDARREQAEARRKDLEAQLSGSKYGVAYADGTEKIVQLNRSVENQLMSQVTYLENLMMSQIGMTEGILNGSADEQTMVNYEARTIEPIVSAIVDEFNRKFVSKTLRSQRKIVKFFKDPFKLVPVNSMAELADKFTRNEIMTSNEIRQIVGLRPSEDPKADELVNSNISQSAEREAEYLNGDANNEQQEEGGELQIGV